MNDNVTLFNKFPPKLQFIILYNKKQGWIYSLQSFKADGSKILALNNSIQYLGLSAWKPEKGGPQMIPTKISPNALSPP